MEAWVKELLAVLQSSEGGLRKAKATETGKNVRNVKRKSESSGSKPRWTHHPLKRKLVIAYQPK